MHCMYCGMPKGMSWDEKTQNQVHNLSYACTKALSRQAGRQAGTQLGKHTGWQLVSFEFCNNLLKAFRVALKALLDLVIPNQYC